MSASIVSNGNEAVIINTQRNFAWANLYTNTRGLETVSGIVIDGDITTFRFDAEGDLVLSAKQKCEAWANETLGV